MTPVAVLNVVGLSASLLGDAAPRLREHAREGGGVRLLRPPFPAVTCTSQASMLTGLDPCDHGVVGNGWFDRELQEVHFWKQSNHLVSGEKVWEKARRHDAACTCANLFWWFNMASSADIAVTPRPLYRADGRKVPDCWTKPSEWRDELQAAIGKFPLFRFWGPGADIRSTDWIAAAARRTAEKFAPSLSLIYLPHLDYPLQKLGPEHPEMRQHIREIDRVCGSLIDFFRGRGARVLVTSEYGIAPMRRVIEPNRALKESGHLVTRDELGGQHLDPIASAAFAVCDHQAAHVYVRDATQVSAVAEVLGALPGVERVLDRAAQRGLRIDHPRAGELVLEAAPDAWFAYRYWDEGQEPDFARTVDIHRKPGYDPCELFIDPRISLPQLAIGWRLLKRKLGFRTLLDVIPLDPTLVRGSHGRVEVARGLEPLLFGDGLDAFDPPASGPFLPMTSVRDAILTALFA
ncbi:MAG: alkaline phosphatase family protein [Phycisphaerae bacterium]|nr:alkaline phosphatase family protein [Phycisphaerae bacterium]